jgi:hypothetical protein
LVAVFQSVPGVVRKSCNVSALFDRAPPEAT